MNNNLSISFKRFTVVYLLAVALLIAISTALEAMFDIQIGSAAGIGATIGAAMDAGQQFYKKHSQRPEKATAWRLASYMTLIQLAISLPVLIIILSLNFDMDAMGYVMALTVGLIIGGLMTLLATRFSFSSGAKQQEKFELSNG